MEVAVVEAVVASSGSPRTQDAKSASQRPGATASGGVKSFFFFFFLKENKITTR
jgi:hypothetical protein